MANFTFSRGWAKIAKMVAGKKTGVVVCETKRKVFSGEFKAKVALDAVRGVKTTVDPSVKTVLGLI